MIYNHAVKEVRAAAATAAMTRNRCPNTRGRTTLSSQLRRSNLLLLLLFIVVVVTITIIIIIFVAIIVDCILF